MIVKRSGIALAVLLLCAGMGFSQSLNGFEVDINLKTQLFGLEKNGKSDVEQRKGAGDYDPQKIFWPGARDGEWIEDAGFSIKYDGSFFGGSIGVGTTTKDGREDVVSSTAKFNSLNAWLMPFGPYFKLTVGVGIEAGYADSLDADPGLRIYDSNEQDSWDSNINPDNITQDEGVLLEGFFGPLSLALAGRYYTPVVARWASNSGQALGWKYVDEKNFSYGGRIGYEIGSFGKVNASYLMEFQSATAAGADGKPVADNWTTDSKGNVVPAFPYAEKTIHMFGVYGSLTPIENLGVTVGYVGEITKLLDEFYTTGDSSPLKTSWPLTYQQAINLNLRYSGLERWIIRTDHNYSFWTDKDYTIFGFPGTKNMGEASTIKAAGYAEVDHILLWNGLGVSYQINQNWKADIYVRNLYRRDTAVGANGSGEYRYMKDELKGELKAIWQPNELLEFYIGAEASYLMTTTSRDIHLAWVGGESGGGTGFVIPDDAADTVESTLTIKIPVGITVRLR